MPEGPSLFSQPLVCCALYLVSLATATEVLHPAAGRPLTALLAKMCIAWCSIPQLRYGRASPAGAKWSGSLATAENVALLTGLITPGAHTQTTLLTAVAELSLNKINVNLVGLAETGLGYL